MGRFAEMETKLGEIDRARAIYIHASQMCDPRVTADFWQIWKEFEVKHGNEDTLRENPDEIDISDEDEEEEEGAPVNKVSNVEEMDVPEAVFGSLKKNNEDNQ